jgi:hypothetical protein
MPVPTEVAEEGDSTKEYSYDVSLRFHHPSIDPAVITAALCLKPRWAWRAGEPRRTPRGDPLEGERRNSYWVARIISKGKSVEKDLRVAINEALDQPLTDRPEFHRQRPCRCTAANWRSGPGTDSCTAKILGGNVLSVGSG